MALPAWKAIHGLHIPLRVEEFQGASETPGHVKEVLVRNGYMFKRAKNSSMWLIDTPRFLKQNNAVCGFLVRDDDGWKAIRLDGQVWKHVDASGESVYAEEGIVHLPSALWLVLKAWMPFQQFLDTNRTLYVRTPDLSKHVRYELEPEGGYRPVCVDYSNRVKSVQRAIREFATPVLISNGTQMVISTPTEEGWISDKLYEFEAYPVERIADDVIHKCSEALGAAPEHLDSRVSTFTAHALYAVCRTLGIAVDLRETVAPLSTEEKQSLETYLERLHEHTGTTLLGSGDDT